MVKRTSDITAVARILNHPKVHPYVVDDGSASVFVPGENDFYIMNKEKTGVVRVDQLNAVSCMIHFAALPELWGKVRQFGLEAIDWGFRHTSYCKIVAMIPYFNRLTIKLCLGCGFSEEGCVTKSFLKNWKFYDQIVYGLTKTDFYNDRIKEGEQCQQQL